MKTEDIDRKIGMPDVDAEWAKFEREVIGEETQAKKRSLAPWAWGIGIAASIAVVTGLFLFGNGSKGENEGSVAMTEENKSEVPEEKDVNDGNAEKAITSNIIGNKSENLLAEVSDSEMLDSLQRRIAGLDIVPNSSHLGANTMRLSGTSGQNGRDKDSVLVMVDGEAMLMAKKQIATEENLEHFLKKDIESIMVYKDEDNKRPYVEKYGELAKNGVVDIKTKPTQRTYEYEVLANAAKEDALQGHIAGLGGDSLVIHFVSKTERPSLPYIWERDTVLVLVNGKEDSDFLRYLSSMPHGAMSNVYDYFFERNQLFLKQSLPSKEEQAALYDPSLFDGRDIRLVVDYQTKLFTPVSQLTSDQIKSRRLAYLQSKYCAGFSKKSALDSYSLDLYDTPVKERLFGLTVARFRSYGQQHEYFGPMGNDSHGVYVPLIRDVVMTTNDDAWWENGEVWVVKDDPRFNQIVEDIRHTATHAESSMMGGDSIVRLAFIFGGKVAEGQANGLLSGMQKQLYEKVKGSSFKFKPDEDAPSYWWGEAYYSTTSQRQLWMHLHSVDKLYAADCPELLSNRRHVEGTVTDENGEPLAGANVGIGFVTPWDAVVTDSQGHFDLWMPFRDATIHVNHEGYQPKQIQPADSIITIRMKDATQLVEVRVMPKDV